MLRGGGLCINEAQEDSLNKVSPRIRALQDRLLDSLPADGAWECLSPAQREAIISLHRGRITRNLVDKSPPEKLRKNNKVVENDLNRCGRSRSYEEKLESETDDSGVRLMSGETPSTSTSNSQNSHEDDSSDPGIKRGGGRFTKSPRIAKVEQQKTPSYESGNKRKGGGGAITNGVGNVNRIISKQLNRNAAAHQISPSKVTLDCRNVVGDNRRAKIKADNFVDPKTPTTRRYRRYSVEKKQQPVKQEKFSRRNILQRYQQDSLPKPSVPKEAPAPIITTPSEENDSRGANFRVSSVENQRDFDLDSDRFLRTNSGSAPYPREISLQETRLRYSSRSNEQLLEDSLGRGHFSLDSSYLNRKHRLKEPQDFRTKVPAGSNLNSIQYDYRTQLNRDGPNKYSNNWKEIVVKKRFPNFIKRTAPGRPLEDKKLEKSQVARKYIRSKSLDRKYLEDSTDDESDFEIRRRTERMRRYTKASQEYESQKLSVYPPPRNDAYSKPRAKSAWDLTDNEMKGSSAHHEDRGNFFKSRKKILNKWKSEDADLCLDLEENKLRNNNNRNKSKWRRRSCDYELDSPADSPRLNRVKEWQRRSCDFNLDVDGTSNHKDSSSNPRDYYHDRWNNSIDSEIKLLQQRNLQNVNKPTDEEPPRLYRTRKEELPPNERIYPVASHCPIAVPPDRVEPPPRAKRSAENFRSELKPEICGRKWTRAEGNSSAPPKYSAHKLEKNKSPYAFRGKLRLFKSLLSF